MREKILKFKDGIQMFAMLSGMVVLQSCATTPGETTGVGAAAGGVLGAGLGAIVGSQTGDAGSGLALGAAAGTATGALVANAIQAQEEEMDKQSEMIRRQDKTLMTQRAEIAALRARLSDGTDEMTPSGFKQSGFSEEIRPETVTESDIKPRMPRRQEGWQDVSPSKEADEQVQNSDFTQSEPRTESIPEPKLSVKTNEIRQSSGSGKLASGRGLSSTSDLSSKEMIRTRKSLPRKDSLSRLGDTTSGESKPLSASHPLNRYASKFDSESKSLNTGSTLSDSPSEQQQARDIPHQEQIQERVVKESNIPVIEAEIVEPEPIGSLEIEPVNQERAETTLGALAEPKNESLDDCQLASKEIVQGKSAGLAADKLFHIRRALRLCPQEAGYHVELARVYKTLGRDADAAFEFHQALKLDPENQVAKNGLQEIGNG